MAPSKIDKLTAMVLENRSAYVNLRLSNLNVFGSMAKHDMTAVLASKTNLSGHSDSSVALTPEVTPTTVPMHEQYLVAFAAHDQPITPGPKRRWRARPEHNEENAHLFNNAGLLIPSVPGIDPVTGRLFDRGEIMSLGQSHDSYYPNGEILDGSFLLEYSNEKKRKRDYEN